MVTFLVVLDVILAFFIIVGIFFHRGSDGFMGETTQTIATNIKFETYDKIMGCFVLGFFMVTLAINYITIYQSKGTADIDALVEKAKIEKRLKEKDLQDTQDTKDTKQDDIPKIKTEAPLAQ